MLLGLFDGDLLSVVFWWLNVFLDNELFLLYLGEQYERQTWVRLRIDISIDSKEICDKLNGEDKRQFWPGLQTTRWRKKLKLSCYLWKKSCNGNQFKLMDFLSLTSKLEAQRDYFTSLMRRIEILGFWTLAICFSCQVYEIFN